MKKHVITTPGLGDAILTIAWAQKYYRGLPLYVTPEKNKPDLYKLMGVTVDVTTDTDITPAGHGFPIRVPSITMDKHPAMVEPYYTCQFDGVSRYPGAPGLKKFNKQEIDAIKAKYRYEKFIDVGGKTKSLEEIQRLMMYSQGHVGVDSGMAWFALMCGVKNVDVWYNGYASPSTWDVNWPLNFAYNGANIRFYDPN